MMIKQAVTSFSFDLFLFICCLNYFSVALIKPWPRELIGRRVYLSLEFWVPEELESVMVGRHGEGARQEQKLSTQVFKQAQKAESNGRSSKA